VQGHSCHNKLTVNHNTKVMTKGLVTKKSQKKEPTKSLKEKRKEKKEKKNAK
jgi:hypothetical protein